MADIILRGGPADIEFADETTASATLALAGQAAGSAASSASGGFLIAGTAEGSDTGVCMAGLPEQYFVVPDPWIPELISATSEAGASPGVTVPGDDPQGRLVPVQSGTLSDLAVPVSYVLSASGGPETAEFVWVDTGTGGNYKGKDDIRHFSGFHSPFTTTPGSDNNAAVYAANFRRVLALGISGTTLYVRYRDIDTTRYDDWTQTTYTLRKAVEAGEHSLAACPLPDGGLLIAVRIASTSGPGSDFDIYRSDDGGLTWDLVSRQILFRFTTNVDAQHLDVQIRMSIAGEFIRLCWVKDGGSDVETVLSRDRGASWQALDTLTPAASGIQGDADDVMPCDIVGIDDAGSFIASIALANGTIGYYQARGAGAWSLVVSYGTVVTTLVKAVALVRHPLWIYAFEFASDGSASNVDYWTIRRVKPSDFAISARYQTIPGRTSIAPDGLQWNPCRMFSVWAGVSMFHYCARKSEGPGVTVANGTAWYSEQWTERPIGEYGPGTPLIRVGQLWSSTWWVAGHGRPSTGAGTGWVQTTGGTGSDTVTQDNLEIVGAAPGDVLSYHNALGSGGTWYTLGGLIEFFVRLDSGDSATSSENVALRAAASNAALTSVYDWSIRIGPSAVTVFDNVSGTTKATVGSLSIDTGSTGAYHLVRFWKVGNAFQIAVLNTGTGVWSTGGGTLATLGGVGFGAPTGTFGHLGQAQATQMRSWWREVRWSSNGSAYNQDQAIPVAEGGDVSAMFGASASPAPYYIEHGLQVGWAGVGGGDGDEFTGEIAHAYPGEAVFLDSPRLAWRSTSIAAQTLIFGMPVNSRFRHDAIAIFGCNNRQILVDYDDTSAFASPTTAETVDFTAYGSAADPIVVASTSGNTLTISDPPWIAGELVGFYVRVLSGGAAGKTFRISRHPADGSLQCDDEGTALSTQGLASSDTFVVFSTFTAFRYLNGAVNKRYMRLRTVDTDTAEGVHRIGTVIVGRKLPISVPLDWAFTDDEQPNVTQYRTKSGIAWAFAEGPSQRSITGRVVGDTSRWRERFRGMFRAIAFEKRVAALVLSASSPGLTAICGRVSGGATLDNAAWLKSAVDGSIYTAGDLSLKFTEEP